MKITVSNIPEEGLNLQFSRNGSWFSDRLPEAERNDINLEKVDITCSLKRIRDSLYIEGRLDTTIRLACCRCLEEINFPISGDFRYVFSPAEDDHPEEMELSTEDLDYGYYRDDSIDLDPLVYEQIVLQLPLKALCRDSCQGLCPHCGLNLNEGKCNCHDQVVDERFAILKKLKV